MADARILDVLHNSNRSVSLKYRKLVNLNYKASPLIMDARSVHIWNSLICSYFNVVLYMPML